MPSSRALRVQETIPGAAIKVEGSGDRGLELAVHMPGESRSDSVQYTVQDVIG